MNASISLGVRPTDARPSLVEALLRRRSPEKVVRTVPAVPNLHLITGAPALADMDFALKHVRQPERRLADIIRPTSRAFDVTVIDAPAGYSVLSASVPLVAEHLIVPIRAEYLSLESLAHFLRWYRDRRAAQKANARVAGILLTKVDYRRQATKEIVNIIRMHNRQGVFRTEIPDDPRVAEAPSHGIPLVLYARSSATKAYHRLVAELEARLARTEK
jgi:chromosome partitioning protein